MRILIDTHIFLWWDHELDRVPAKLRAAIEDQSNRIFVSVASVWEIAIKRATGKLAFAAPIVATISAEGFDLVNITAEHAERAGRLPRYHTDPFDRLLLAQADLEGMVLGTHDRLMVPYGVAIVGL